MSRAIRHRRYAIVGDWQHAIYEESLARALIRLGHSAVKISYGSNRANGELSLLLKTSVVRPNVLTSMLAGRRVSAALDAADPEIIFVWRGEPIDARSLKRFRSSRPESYWVYYSNDSLADPGSRVRWSKVVDALPLYDRILVYRESDRLYLREMGLEASIWLPSYDPSILGQPTDDSLGTRPFDVVFVGHYENDGRGDVVSRLAECGCRVGVWGAWPRIKGVYLQPVAAVGRAYSAAVAAGRMSLVLFSRRNGDSLTRRSFELPYIGTPMLSQRTNPMRALFAEGVCAAYFDDPTEACDKATAMLADIPRLEDMRRAARERLADLHAGIDDRANELLAMTP
jgi:spore maturation protein CgeB